jgi:hypothetical protein
MNNKKLKSYKRKLLKLQSKVNNSLLFLENDIEKLKSEKLDYVQFMNSVSNLTEKYLKPLNQLLDRFNEKSWYVQHRIVSSSIHELIYENSFLHKELAYEVYNLFHETCREVLNVSSKMSKIITPFLSARAFS